ncbi:zinc-dependent alcohol dehydrogenase [Nakamurella leprariae]|uniref:Alcohol dehydrogenase catalytic domain-containing protein n=1 Tax=Nakamurella leprariae TaxID=2803911 RepID=A0A938YEC4_9ACTN|nr:alcohol dehydrogenase catalytic domain-containing protein [Nakamurella leprariae]MBM9469157.1 alcohol dehydrogenase catalytic domain-containing protein [Nakamurella leprariae]
MRLATWEAIEMVKLNDLPEFDPGPKDVIIDVGACGICGSDVHAYVEGAWTAPGKPLGHEFAGTVSWVGAEVAGLSVGDRIAVNPAVPCGQCARCQDGRFNLCNNRQGGGSGGFADRVLFTNGTVGRQLFVMPDDVSFEEAAFLEPLSVAARAVDHAEIKLDEPVLVFGLGSIGACVLQVLLAQGAKDIIVVDTSEARREAARKAGAHEVLDPIATDVVAHLLETRGTTTSPYQESGAIGSIIDSSGAVQVLPGALTLLRAAGTLSLVGLASRDAAININDIVQKEIRVQGSFAYTPADCAYAADLIATKKVDLTPLVSHTFNLDDITEAFETQRQTATSIKVMVSPTA